MKGQTVWLTNFKHQNPYGEANSRSATQKKSLLLWNVHCRVQKSPPLDPVMGQMNQIHTFMNLCLGIDPSVLTVTLKVAYITYSMPFSNHMPLLNWSLSFLKYVLFSESPACHHGRTANWFTGRRSRCWPPTCPYQSRWKRAPSIASSVFIFLNVTATAQLA
jgi:hypothetical protein